ncbi:uncharacterized protein LOC6560038 [Drosophila grimshawi]|uniref:GH21521 n=1 Tax=Drosophila grimshawi TaxID=7222 RepID=B4J402_DROGR|nr:uncharacterized protein LOC6560038 [Drosophila grimshawi]EDW01585.1 GH21521 [Drosophila grimshawi]
MKSNRDSKLLINTNINLISIPPSSRASFKNDGLEQLKAGASMVHYSEHIVEEILAEMFAERRGHFPETSSSCEKDQVNMAQHATEQHVDRRLKYWREMLLKRRRMQKRVEIQTGKSPEEVLFNRRSTLESRNKETVLRIMDYAERLQPENLVTKPVSQLKEIENRCAYLGPIKETWPQAEQLGVKNVEIIGLPSVIQTELLGSEAANRKLQHSWMKSDVLDGRISERFDDVRQVIEFFPDLDKLQVTGRSIEQLRPIQRTVLLKEEHLVTVTTSSDEMCSEEQYCEGWTEPLVSELEPTSVPEPPELGLSVNGKDYIVYEKGFTECLDMLTKFKCDPFQRRIKLVLKLKNIGKQMLSFSWTQGVYYYNCGKLLLAQDNEFHFDTDNFRLKCGESYNLMVMYQPRKVSMAVELWRLQVEPRIFCGKQESLQLRFHGRCTPPKEYMARLKELHSVAMCKANIIVMKELTTHLAEIVPLIEPPPACCPYDRAIDVRELFNSLNPGYNCIRFDDLEVLKGMHKQLKKPREPHWDFRLDTIKMLIMRIESFDRREEMFASLMVLLEPLFGPAPSLEYLSQLDTQKQRTRFIFVRGVICNGIEEWEDLVFTTEESFYKPELQRYYMHLLEEAEEEDVVEGIPRSKMKLSSNLDVEELADHFDEKAHTAVFRKLIHSKFFRDALYMQTYSHLCNIAENVVSVIESTDVVPT